MSAGALAGMRAPMMSGSHRAMFASSISCAESSLRYGGEAHHHAPSAAVHGILAGGLANQMRAMGISLAGDTHKLNCG